MRKFTLIIPIMLLVVAVAMWMLKRDYSEIDYQTRVLISVGASILSGVISFFLFRLNDGKG